MANLNRLNDSIKALNDAVTTGVDFDSMLENARKEIEMYNKDLKREKFGELYATESPLLEAVTQLKLPTKVLKRDPESGKYRANDSTKDINIIEFVNYKEENSREWQNTLEKLMFAVSLNIAKNLNPDSMEKVHAQNQTVEKLEDILQRNYKLSSNISGTFKVTNDFSSINSILKLLQQSINELVTVYGMKTENENGSRIYPARKSDVRYMLQLAAKRNGSCSVKMPNLKSFSDLFMDILRFLMTDEQRINLDLGANNNNK